eukprot:TRINITY_DN5800_c0_g1_i2.p1 TRINITY_DN5800_c0_g1~~TRINITY_DN5800_c0_g1_i2.p1  ORF type:complete len:633 (+),score=183.85 TRINITY_DN5800_c0_g1_i2:101-1999(+)
MSSSDAFSFDEDDFSINTVPASGKSSMVPAAVPKKSFRTRPSFDEEELLAQTAKLLDDVGKHTGSSPVGRRFTSRAAATFAASKRNDPPLYGARRAAEPVAASTDSIPDPWASANGARGFTSPANSGAPLTRLASMSSLDDLAPLHRLSTDSIRASTDDSAVRSDTRDTPAPPLLAARDPRPLLAAEKRAAAARESAQGLAATTGAEPATYAEVKAALATIDEALAFDPLLPAHSPSRSTPSRSSVRSSAEPARKISVPRDVLSEMASDPRVRPKSHDAGSSRSRSEHRARPSSSHERFSALRSSVVGLASTHAPTIDTRTERVVEGLFHTCHGDVPLFVACVMQIAERLGTFDGTMARLSDTALEIEWKYKAKPKPEPKSRSDASSSSYDNYTDYRNGFSDDIDADVYMTDDSDDLSTPYYDAAPATRSASVKHEPDFKIPYFSRASAEPTRTLPAQRSTPGKPESYPVLAGSASAASAASVARFVPQAVSRTPTAQRNGSYAERSPATFSSTPQSARNGSYTERSSSSGLASTPTSARSAMSAQSSISASSSASQQRTWGASSSSLFSYRDARPRVVSAPKPASQTSLFATKAPVDLNATSGLSSAIAGQAHKRKNVMGGGFKVARKPTN